MSTDNFEKKIENVVNKIENSANDAWKNDHFVFYQNPYLP